MFTKIITYWMTVNIQNPSQIDSKSKQKQDNTYF